MTHDYRSCRYCGRWLPIDSFSVSNRINGVIYRRHRCNDCKMEIQKERRQQIAVWLEEYKKEQECAKCGINDFRVLHFDHLRDKAFNIGNTSSHGMSKRRIVEEIAKCQVLCANCHAIKTYNDRTN